MATKKQKRERAEAKRAAFMAEIRASGLAAQKADHERQRIREKKMDAEISNINQRHRSVLLDHGVNPRTGLLFTDSEMEAMKEKANTAERKNRYERIVEGRAAMLNTGWNKDEVPRDDLDGMTVKEFTDKMDQFYTGMGWNL